MSGYPRWIEQANELSDRTLERWMQTLNNDRLARETDRTPRDRDDRCPCGRHVLAGGARDARAGAALAPSDEWRTANIG